MPQHSLAFSRSHLVLLAVLAVLAAAAFGAVGASSAQAASCSDDGNPKYPSSRGGYFVNLRVTNVTCASGRKLMKAYHTCRVENGKGLKGRCTRKVLGYSCTEKRGSASATEFNATVTCRRDARRVFYAYQQNLR